MNIKKISLILMSVLLLGACQTQPAATSSPLPPAPTNTPAPEATINCSPDIHASSIADVVGVWAGLTGSPGKGNLELTADGAYAIKLVEPNASAGVPKGFIIDSGKFRFDGAQLKFENASCQDVQGNLFTCVGIYEACVTKQGNQPTQLKLVVIDDKFTGRRLGLTNQPLSIAQP